MTLPALKPARGSQCERVLGVLSDGRPHTVPEIHDRAGTMRLNSRIAELRKRGHNIVCEHMGGTGAGAYFYRLVGPLSPGVPEAATESEATTHGLVAARDGEQTDGVQPPSPTPGLSDPSSAGDGPSGSGREQGYPDSQSRPDDLPRDDAHGASGGPSPAEEEDPDLIELRKRRHRVIEMRDANPHLDHWKVDRLVLPAMDREIARLEKLAAGDRVRRIL